MSAVLSIAFLEQTDSTMDFTSFSTETGKRLSAPTPEINVSVCVLNWNDPVRLRGCLQSLRDVKALNDVNYEVIVIDNGSTDSSRELVLNEFPLVRLVALPQNIALAAAYNQGLRLGRGRFLVILNNDIVVLDDCLSRMARFLTEDSTAGIVVARLLDPNGSVQERYYLCKLPSLRSLFAELSWLDRIWPNNPWGHKAGARGWDPDKIFQMEQVPGAAMMVKREVVERVGLLDEGFRFGYEDVDFCNRCGKAGWTLWYLPDARVVHYGGASVAMMESRDTSLFRFRGLLRYSQKYFTPRQYFILRLLVAGILVLRLPVVFALELWPKASVRTRWKGTHRVYLRLFWESLTATTRVAC